MSCSVQLVYLALVSTYTFDMHILLDLICELMWEHENSCLEAGRSNKGLLVWLMSIIAAKVS